MQDNWRLLLYKTADAAYNMAVDEAILEAHLQGIVPPTLRLYGFNPGAISIGHSQTLAEDVLARAANHGLDVVRRPTGGRAVLHLNELTYSFVGSSVALSKSAGSPAAVAVLSESITEAYKQICLGLCLALSALGVDLELGATNVPYKHMDDCFAATTGSDLHFQGKKMIGSAQLRRKTAVLQHGSILLNQEQFLMQEILEGKMESPETLRLNGARHANLFEVLSRPLSIADLEAALAQGFAQALGVPFTIGALSAEEQQLASALTAKYKNN